MEKWILVQYADMVVEVKELRRRIDALEKFLDNPPQVSDTVMGSREDLTVGPIKVTGFPNQEYWKKKLLCKRYVDMLQVKEADLLEMTCEAEAYIESMEKAELRNMFRFYFLDGYSYAKTAAAMNSLYPGRTIKYTDENVKKRIQRFFEKVPPCPE